MTPKQPCRKTKRNKRPVPLAPPPSMKSRKKARIVTTLFHKYTRERDVAFQNGNMEQVQEYEQRIQEIGGRKEYQKASQLSTSFHSTSKWVLGTLARNGWLYGIPIECNTTNTNSTDHTTTTTTTTNNNTNTNTSNDTNDYDNDSNTAKDPTTATAFNDKKNDNNNHTIDHNSKKNNNNSTRRKKRNRRFTRLLEVGAINTELLDAAAATTTTTTTTTTTRPANNYKLTVQAIDLHSMEKRIEEKDFLQLPFRSSNIMERYDVIVCSMVLNCVTTPTDRGIMLARLYHHLRPGGLCFLTLPKFCLTKSAFLTVGLFRQLLSSSSSSSSSSSNNTNGNKNNNKSNNKNNNNNNNQYCGGGVGFHILETKETPKVLFFLCQRPDWIEGQQQQQSPQRTLDKQWTTLTVRNKGKKFPNQFSIVLDENEVLGRARI